MFNQVHVPMMQYSTVMMSLINRMCVTLLMFSAVHKYDSDLL